MIKAIKRFLFGECFGSFGEGCPYNNPAVESDRCNYCHMNCLEMLKDMENQVKSLTQSIKKGVIPERVEITYH